MQNRKNTKRHIVLRVRLISVIAMFIIIAAIAFSCGSKKKDTPKTTTNKETTTKFIPTTRQVDRNPIPREKMVRIREKTARELINLKATHSFKIECNLGENFVVVYGMDKQGKYSIPYKCFICSTASNTPVGHFKIGDKDRWHQMVDDSYAQYTMRITGKFMFHSVPYFKASPDKLETEEYNKLGTQASLGCIRLQAGDIEWLYNNCLAGTKVRLYYDKGEQPPFAYEQPPKLRLNGPKSGWDPTDTDPRNPWKNEE